MVDAGYGKAAIPILRKAKELYVRFTDIPSFILLYYQGFRGISFIGKLTVYFPSIHSLQDSLGNETTTDLQTVELYCNINYSLACLYVDLDMLDGAEPLHKDVLRLRER